MGARGRKTISGETKSKMDELILKRLCEVTLKLKEKKNEQQRSE